MDWLETTLEARDGAADVALLPALDLTESSALFCRKVRVSVIRGRGLDRSEGVYTP